MKTIIVVKTLLLDGDGNVLILRRSKTHPKVPHFPDFPGGQLDEGEDFRTALVREIKEEVDLDVDPQAPELIYAGTESKDGENRVRLFFVTRLKSTKPEVKINWEHEGAEWLPLSVLRSVEDEHHSFYKEALRYVREQNLLN